MRIIKLESFRSCILTVFFLGLVTAALTGCPKKQVVKKTVEEEKVLDEEKVESEELDVHEKDFASDQNLETIQFTYDSSELTDAARQILSKNAKYMKQNSGLEILCEGHTDERGTVGYNLALGQKRAQSVRKYYLSLGLSPKRIGSLSYGKEKPACFEGTEECWNQNRRVETKARMMRSASGGSEAKPRVPEKNPK